MEIKELPIYRETQLFRGVWWVIFLILGVAALMWWGLIQQIVFGQPWGTDPAPDWAMWLLWLLIGIGLPLLFWNMGLVTEVPHDRLLIRYVPLYQRSILWNELSTISVQTYQPIRQYGGWGIRGFGDRRAFSVSGDRCVELILKDGSITMIGSQKPAELALAIESQISNQ